MDNNPVPMAPRSQSTLLAWTMLVLLSVAMLGNYYVYDSIAPVADLLRSERGLSNTQIGSLNAVYSLPNLIMVLVGGIVIDRIGATRGVVMFAALCAAGALWFALGTSYLQMVLARFVFGLGAESMIVGVTTAIGRWFGAGRLGLALGLNLSLARAGSFAADMSPGWARTLYDHGCQQPLLLAAGFAGLSLLAGILAWILDARLGVPIPPAQATDGGFRLRQGLRFPPAYWSLVGLCVAIYSVLLPFRSTFAIQYFQDAHGMSREAAGQLNGTVFLAAIFGTPLFGYYLDQPGRRARALLLGAGLLLPVFPMLAFTTWTPWIANVLLGLAYSMVPAVLWPCVTRLVEPQRLGTAYGLCFMVQNIGLMLANLAAGALNDGFGASAQHAAGYQP
ncbi:MAG: MFS transporter, partial [Planctomycetota bacterium]